MSLFAGSGERLTVGAVWAGLVCGFVFVCVPIFGYIWPLGFSALAALGGLLATPLLARPFTPLRPVLAALLVVVLAAVSMSWSRFVPDAARLAKGSAEPLTAFKLVLQLALYPVLLVAASRLTERWARGLCVVLVIGFAALSIVLFAEALQGATLYQTLKANAGQPIRPDLAQKNVAQASYALALLFFPTLLAFVDDRMKWLVWGSAVLAVIGGEMFSADASALAMVLGLVVWAAVRTARKAALGGLAAGAVLYFLAAPFIIRAAVQGGLFAIIHKVVGPSWDARLNIWAYATEKIFEKPWTGWGMDASRTFGLAIPLHTHDGALQVWLELGPAGAVLMAAFWVLVIWALAKATRRDTPVASAGAALIAAYLTIGAVSFGIWQEWWIGLGAIAAAALVVVGRIRAAGDAFAQDGAPTELEYI